MKTVSKTYEAPVCEALLIENNEALLVISGAGNATNEVVEEYDIEL